MKHVTKASAVGRGVFATERIENGEVIMRYSGPLLRYDQTTPQTYAVQVGEDAYLGASGGADDFVNHSCEPNAGLVIQSESDVTLVAIREIEPGEEITFDYSTTMDEDDFEFDCRCGKGGCRGRVRDFKHLPGERKREYARAGIVPGYNMRYVE